MRSSRLAVFALALSLIAAACTSAASSEGTNPPATDASAAPETTFTYFDGSAGSLGDYVGKPVVVNFWASWCPSCVEEMRSAFVPVQEQRGEDVAFLGLNLQDDRAAALQMVADTGVLFDLAEDATGVLYVELGGIGMPFTVFIDGDGTVVATHNGPLDAAQLDAKITEAFG